MKYIRIVLKEDIIFVCICFYRGTVGDLNAQVITQ